VQQGVMLSPVSGNEFRISGKAPKAKNISPLSCIADLLSGYGDIPTFARFDFGTGLRARDSIFLAVIATKPAASASVVRIDLP